eukprot:UN09932
MSLQKQPLVDRVGNDDVKIIKDNKRIIINLLLNKDYKEIEKLFDHNLFNNNGYNNNNILTQTKPSLSNFGQNSLREDLASALGLDSNQIILYGFRSE